MEEKVGGDWVWGRRMEGMRDAVASLPRESPSLPREDVRAEQGSRWEEEEDGILPSSSPLA